MKNLRKFALSLNPHTIGFLGSDSLLQLNPRDVGGHALGFKWLRSDRLPLTLNADEVHWKRVSPSLKMMVPVAVKAVGLSLAMNYGVHISSSLAFDALCIPHSIWDFAQSVVSTASPVCGFFLSTMQMTQGNYATLLTTTATALLAGALSK